MPILQSLYDVPNLILTATATVQIQKDISDVLGLQEEKVEVVAALPNRYDIHYYPSNIVFTSNNIKEGM